MSIIPQATVDAILKAQGDTMQVILLSLPTSPCQVKTPTLLRSLFTKQTFDATMNSFFLQRMYMVCWHFFASTLSDSPLIDAIDTRLRSDQRALLAREGVSDWEFNITNIHAYEVAIVKCLHAKKCLADTDASDETEALMEMSPETVRDLGILKYLTSRVPPESVGKGERHTIDQMMAQQVRLHAEIEEVVAKVEKEKAEEEEEAAEAARLLFARLSH